MWAQRQVVTALNPDMDAAHVEEYMKQMQSNYEAEEGAPPTLPSHPLYFYRSLVGLLCYASLPPAKGPKALFLCLEAHQSIPSRWRKTCHF